MTKNRFLIILVCLLMALPFYVSVWTWDGTALGQRWLYTGLVGLFQGFITGFWYGFAD